MPVQSLQAWRSADQGHGLADHQRHRPAGAWRGKILL